MNFLAVILISIIVIFATTYIIGFLVGSLAFILVILGAPFFWSNTAFSIMGVIIFTVIYTAAAFFWFKCNYFVFATLNNNIRKVTTKKGLIYYSLFGLVLGGIIGSCLGFFGPLFLSTGSQGPLLFIFTGPFGAFIGLIVGVNLSWILKNKKLKAKSD